MQLIDGSLIVSATDLVGFLACDHLVTLELGAVEGNWPRPERDDPEMDLIARHGTEHERRVLEEFRSEGRSIAEIETAAVDSLDELRAAEGQTVEAMRGGADVIYQATLFDGRWRGHADFLLKVDEPSDLGPWSYEVADTKLARRVKAAAILQMCVYSERLAVLQGRVPDRIHVITGDRETHSERLADYAAYYRTVKQRFEERVFGEASRPPTYPDPVDHCRVCRWAVICASRRRRDDHLSLVAGIRKDQIARLAPVGVGTLTKLGSSTAGTPVRDINQITLERLRNQARLQLDQYRTGIPSYELIEPSTDDPGRGLGALPPPSPGDLFFDIEADPYAFDEGLEYLFGVVEENDRVPRYRAFWAHDREAEKRAFEQFVDYVIERLAEHPDMHVYHYAPYEPTALKRLMGRHATREEEVDRLLRGRVLVDLYSVVRQGVRISQESYSIKKVEQLYMPARDGPITEAGFSVVEYEHWLETKEPMLLEELEAYNRDDCVSTWKLRAWLEGRREEAERTFGRSLPRPEPAEGAPSEGVVAASAEVARRVESLTANVPSDPARRTAAEQGRWFLAQLLDWHRREAKPQWWTFYDLAKKSVEELVDEPEALVGLDYVGVVGNVKRRRIHRYRFDPAQDHKFKVGDKPLDHATQRGVGDVVAIDDLEGAIDLLRGVSEPEFHPRALLPAKPIGDGVLRDALLRIADWVIDHDIDAPGPYRAVRDLVLRLPPRLAQSMAPFVRASGPAARRHRALSVLSGGMGQTTLWPEAAASTAATQPSAPGLVLPGEDDLLAARRIALLLDQTCLPIQGPPGSGKTYTAARMIVDLLGAGKRVGITATAHKAILNLLDAVCEAAQGAPVDVRAIHKTDEANAFERNGVIRTEDPKDVAEALRRGEANLAAGTQWVFARDDIEGLLDVLFVDEAGQMSLANVVAIGGAARSIVLLGDPNQLAQVSQGSHPSGAEASALEHILGTERTIPPDRGLFLKTTWRLHPDVCAYVSDVFYDRRLEPHPSTARQRLDAPLPYGGTGIRYVPVTHLHDEIRSRDEANAVAEAVSTLIGRAWTNQRGSTRPITPDDVLVVAPYNAQVAEIRKALDGAGVAARVGTVDKFQGQEAAVALYSMATSSAEDMPRTMDFLYSRNRLNVAISRARGLAILMCSPELLRVHCHTPEQMRLANALCRFVEMAAEQDEAQRAGAATSLA